MKYLTFKATLVSLMVLGAIGPLFNAAMAADPSRRTITSSRQSTVQKLVKGAEIVVDRERYHFLNEVYSIAPQGKKDKQARQQWSNSDTFIENKGGFQIFHRAALQKQKNKQFSRKTSTHPVLLNQRTQQFAIVLGPILTVLHSMSDTDLLAEAYGLKIINRFEHLNLVIFSPMDPELIFENVKKMETDPRIVSVIPELLENLSRPQ